MKEEERRKKDGWHVRMLGLTDCTFSFRWLGAMTGFLGPKDKVLWARRTAPKLPRPANISKLAGPQGLARAAWGS